MGTLDGRVAIITGAGRGIGREHALLFAAEGASVVVNDLGGSPDGTGADLSPAQSVVNEITAAGGQAVANYDDVADWDGSQRLINTAIETFGDLHVLVNNAGILRDRVVVNMTEQEWDSVIKVHLRGHFLPTKWAATYWREQAKSGATVNASIINTTSTSGLMSNPGQTNYGAAKSGIATFTEICQKELARYGVRCNAIAPAARTRLTATIPGSEERTAERLAEAAAIGFDKFDPANISPMVAYLATAGCPIAGKVFFVYGGAIHLFQPWTIIDSIEADHRWTVAELQQAADKWGAVTFDQTIPL
ncbi:MAG: SDR family oxidoreductase [Actinomycetota bacterium]|nr:SDR family oxidoreductase [Actinomycetota bacterium]